MVSESAEGDGQSDRPNNGLKERARLSRLWRASTGGCEVPKPTGGGDRSDGPLMWPRCLQGTPRVGDSAQVAPELAP